jgi:glyoxylase-like metal-dependent hydrolase (beta-lactamase superfamily II)
MHEDSHGGWYVNDHCFNCDTARQLAPELIGEVDGRSKILRQPQNEAEINTLHVAAYACPTRSIRHPSVQLDPTRDPFPMRLDDGVYLCGHNSQQTVGANAYLLVRPAGNMMIDTPRYSKMLAAKYEALGAVTDVLLTHGDHAAHGRRYADRFGARLWIHEGDLSEAPDADQILRGKDPIEVAKGVIAHPLPGHTEGSVLYVADERHCFSGDSIYWSRATEDVEVFETVTWYSITELAASLARSVGRLHFEWLLPGHGGRKRLPAEEMTRRLQALTTRVQALQPQPEDISAVQW